MKNCVFCDIAAERIKSFKVFEDDDVCAFFDINPASEYHTLVIPKLHYENIFDTPEQLLVKVIKTVKIIACHYKEEIGIDNIQIINSSGREAQQDVFHFHFHIVPRSYDDGQNIKWTPNTEIRQRFDDLLKKAKQ